MEYEVVDKKRIAQEQRQINQTFDGRLRHESSSRKKNTQKINNDIKE